MPLDAFSALDSFIEFEAWAVFASLAAVVGYRLLTGHINARGLLNDKSTHKIDPGRVQLLITTLFAAVSYLANPHAFANAPIGAGAAAALGGSHLFYLVQKYRALAA